MQPLSKLWYSKRRGGTLLEMRYVICICVCAATHSIFTIDLLFYCAWDGSPCGLRIALHRLFFIYLHTSYNIETNT